LDNGVGEDLRGGCFGGDAVAMEAAEQQGFAVEVYGDLDLSLESPPLYIGLGGPLAPPQYHPYVLGKP
jgi:hypothetical protein